MRQIPEQPTASHLFLNRLFSSRLFSSRLFSSHRFSRRRLLRASAGLIGVGSLSAGLAGDAVAAPLGDRADRPMPAQPLGSGPARPHIQTSLTPDQALAQLLLGNQRFVTRHQLNPHQDRARITEIARGQAPFAAILSCADSRVVPEIAFDQGLGDLFVVRVAGNVANIANLASEEYAIALLGVPLLMVLGHERCGAVDAALQGGELPGSLSSLVAAIQPAIQATEGTKGDRLANTVKANVRLQVQRLQASPVIAASVQAGSLKVVGGYYDLDTGKISLVA